jgi:hypothetical protein
VPPSLRDGVTVSSVVTDPRRHRRFEDHGGGLDGARRCWFQIGHKTSSASCWFLISRLATVGPSVIWVYLSASDMSHKCVLDIDLLLRTGREIHFATNGIL